MNELYLEMKFIIEFALFLINGFLTIFLYESILTMTFVGSFDIRYLDIFFHGESIAFVLLDIVLIVWHFHFKNSVKRSEEFEKGREFSRKQLKYIDGDYDKFDELDVKYGEFVKHAMGNFNIFCFKKGFEHERKVQDYQVKHQMRVKAHVQEKIDEMMDV